jgi:hypothetical protein
MGDLTSPLSYWRSAPHADSPSRSDRRAPQLERVSCRRWIEMRLTRCDACGAKALFAASQCPRCGHLLELRDTRGNPVPVTRCRECDTYFLSKKGRCRWCEIPGVSSTTVRVEKETSTFRVAPFAFGLLGIAVVVGAAWGALRAPRDPDVVVAAPSRAAKQSAGSVTPRVNPKPVVALPSVEMLAAAEKAAVGETNATAATPAPAKRLAAAETLTIAETRIAAEAPAAATRAVAGTRAAVERPAAVRKLAANETDAAAGRRAAAEPRAITSVAAAQSPDTGHGARVQSRADRRWVSSTTRTLVKVRSQASRRAAIVGIVTPETRVQLGESRAGWLRLRTLGISGWVEQSSFVSDSTSPPR